MSKLKREIVVVGGGLAGFSAAIGLALEGFDTVLAAPLPPAEDRRSTALIGPSIAFLDRIGILDRFLEKAEPLATMRIVDDTGRLLRAPTVEFRAGEIGLPAFGYNVLNADLSAALAARVAELGDRLTILASGARRVVASGESVEVTLDDGGTIAASLVVGADGRRSVVREEADIAMREWHYPQTALVLNFRHEASHHGISTEFHTPTGPFTQVPLPGRRSSLVWVEKPETASLLVDVHTGRLAEIVERKLHSILGKVEIDGPVQAFPLKGGVATAMTGPRIALVGEAAHVFPPIGAQGLNLGLRDARDLVAAAATARDDPGRPAAMARYEGSRRKDVLSRTVGVDALNRSLLAGFLPVQATRAFGLSAMAALPALRHFAMREGTSPGGGIFGLKALRESFMRTG